MSSINNISSVPQTLTNNPTQSMTTPEAVKRIAQKVEPTPLVNPHPNLNQSSSQINRSYEMIKEPAVTVLKFTDASTKEVILQIPTEQSIKTYQEVEKFIAQQSANKGGTNIVV